MTRGQAGRYLLVAAVAGTLAASATAQTSEPKARPLLVGVVDLGVVFLRYQRTADVAREVERDKEALAAKTSEQQRAIDALAKDLDAAPAGTEVYREKAAELKLAHKALDAMNLEADAIAQQRFETLTLQEIDEIDESVREFAKANHYDLIVKTTTKGWGEKKLPERLYRAQISTVVAYDPKLDVTEQILARLNDVENLKKHGAH